MFAGRSARFTPRIQAAILVSLLVIMIFGCWMFADAIRTPDKVPMWRAVVGALMFSLAAEPFGVLIALALSRKNDTG